MSNSKKMQVNTKTMIAMMSITGIFILSESQKFLSMLDPETKWDLSIVLPLTAVLFSIMIIKITKNSIDRTLKEQQRKEQTLNSVSSQVMIADENYNIIYLNPELMKMLDLDSLCATGT